jgi:hypothetical protein
MKEKCLFCLQQGSVLALMVALPPTIPENIRVQIFVEIFKDQHFCTALNEMLGNHVQLLFTSTGFYTAYQSSKFYKTAIKHKDELERQFTSTAYTISYSRHLHQFSIQKKGKYCLITNIF